MSGVENSGEPAAAAGTLGEVLYTNKARALVLEPEWARLVEGVAAGDQRALHALYERTHRIVYTLAIRITNSRETAEEVTLDVFHDVWRRAAGYDPANGTVIGWIMNQARSRSIDRVRLEQRKKRVNPNADDPQPVAAEPDPQDRLEQGEKSNLLRSALGALTADERQAIETAYFAELTYAETAGKLNQPLGTVKTRIRSGLAKLRKAMGDPDER